MKSYDNHRSGTGKGRQHPKWRRLFRDTSRRWRMFRLSNQAIAIHRHTTRRSRRGSRWTRRRLQPWKIAWCRSSGRTREESSAWNCPTSSGRRRCSSRSQSTKRQPPQQAQGRRRSNGGRQKVKRQPEPMLSIKEKVKETIKVRAKD